MRHWGWWFLLAGMSVWGAGNPLDFSQYPAGKLPPGFTATSNAENDASQWRIAETNVPDPLRPGKTIKRRVLARLGSKDADSKLSSVLLYDKQKLDELEARVSFRVASGQGVQAAGLVFRAVDGKNYYLSAVQPRNGKHFFSILEKGIWVPLFARPVSIPADGWITLDVKWKGNEITLRMNQDNIPVAVKREVFPAGHVGFWARSDSTVYFTAARAAFPEQLAISLAKRLVRGHPRLIGLDIFTLSPGGAQSVIAVSDNEKGLGKAGPAHLREVITQGTTFYKKKKNIATVSMPVKDPNGKPFAAARMFWETRSIQSKNFDLANSTRLMRQVELDFRSARDLRK